MRHGSLFSGIGGFDLAAEWMGWENVFHCEWNEFGQKVLKHYWPKAISYEDITKTDFTIHRGNIDILTGGFPCQPYSSAGKRLGKEDERHLWPEMLRAIREIKPPWVVGENVYGLVNWSGGLVFHEVQADLEAEGYEVQPYLLPAVSVNAPHRRDRIWFVAHSKSAGTRSDIGGIRSVPERCDKWKEDDASSTNPASNGYQNGHKESRGQERSSKQRWMQQSSGMGREWDAADTNSNGQHISHSKHEINASERRVDAQRDSQQSNGDGNAADTMQVRLQQCEDGGEVGGGQTEVCGAGRELANGTEANGEVRDASDTEQTTTNTKCIGRIEVWNDNGFIEAAQQAKCREQQFSRTNSTQGWWRDFPSVSPICIGDDGLSNRLDNITFPKWRNESIKAGGNAVVPQVVYQIFKTIEAYEKMGI